MVTGIKLDQASKVAQDTIDAAGWLISLYIEIIPSLMLGNNDLERCNLPCLQLVKSRERHNLQDLQCNALSLKHLKRSNCYNLTCLQLWRKCK